GEEARIGIHGTVVLLQEHLEAVGDGLQKSPRPDAVWPDAVLRPGGDLALEEDQVSDGEQDRAMRDDRDEDPGGDVRFDPIHGVICSISRSLRRAVPLELPDQNDWPGLRR